MDKNKQELFESAPIPKAVAKLAIPTALSTLVMILYNLADTYFVGLLGDAVQTAAVSLAATMLLAFNAINNLFGVGASSLMSRSLGKKDYDTAKKTAAFCFWLAFICAAAVAAGYTVFRTPMLRLLGADETTAAATGKYLLWTCSCGAIPAILNVVLANMIRSEGEALHSGIGVISGCILNIILDPFFVLPRFLNMGAAGAGLATLISNCFAMSYMLLFVFRKRKTTVVCLDPASFCFRRDIFREVFGVGVPASIQNLLNVTGALILNNLTSVYGAAAVSGMGVAHRIAMMPMFISMGITQGVISLIGYNFASGNRKRMKEAVMFVLWLTLGITIVNCAGFIVFAGPLVRLFMANDEVVAYGSRLLRAMSIGIPFLGIDFLGVAVYQAIGKGIYSLFFAIARKILLEVPAIIVFNRLLPLYGMGYSQPFAEFILCIAACFMLRKILSAEPPQEKIL